MHRPEQESWKQPRVRATKELPLQRLGVFADACLSCARRRARVSAAMGAGSELRRGAGLRRAPNEPQLGAGRQQDHVVADPPAPVGRRSITDKPSAGLEEFNHHFPSHYDACAKCSASACASS